MKQKEGNEMIEVTGGVASFLASKRLSKSLTPTDERRDKDN